MESSPPALSLPPELLSEIFEYFPENNRPVIGGKDSPLILGLVCGYWRDVALSLPTLWSSFFINAKTYPETFEEDAPHLELLPLWIRRSGGVPLAFDFSASDGALCRALLKELLLHSRRWSHAAFYVPLNLLRNITGDMPLLKHLDISPHGLPTDEELFTVVDNAPQLTHAVLGDCFVPDVVRLPWKQLTHITGLCLYESEAVYILKLAVNLVHCKVYIVDGTEINDDQPNVESGLRHLEIHMRDSDASLAHVIGGLSLPSLEFFSVHQSLLTRHDFELIKELISRLSGGTTFCDTCYI
ncbi:hypothetical protein C8F01DRAFT_1255657 [Mycena amicta]|nr:hypothetical protein C8F01DRAFT_1255657 [Mycena amicta]